MEDSQHDLLAFQRGPYRRAADAPRPGVIVLNDRLPRLDGQAVLAFLQEDADLADIPVIFFTSSESAPKERSSDDHGTRACVVKPMTYEDLSRTVRRISRFGEMEEGPENPA